MCKICEDFNGDMPADERLQGMRNLFEVKEQLGVEHTSEVVKMLSINMDYDKDNLDGRIIHALSVNDTKCKHRDHVLRTKWERGELTIQCLCLSDV